MRGEAMVREANVGGAHWCANVLRRGISARFEVLLFAALLVAAWPGPGWAKDAAEAVCGTEVVTTSSGPVCGVAEDRPERSGVEVFRGIPYAGSVAKEFRWTAPRHVEPWSKTRVADTFGAVCPQSGLFSPGEEDCLFLNFWRPAGTKADAGLPVMVFIHGGGFYQGASSDPLYNGGLLVKDGVILFTINYRLGALGYLAAGDVAGGNYGILDQQLAMKWIRDNAPAFGGNPERITLFGESAGAMSIGLHLTTAPASRSLFSAAIMESNLLGVPYRSLKVGQNEAALFMAMAGCEDVGCLRRMDIDTLQKQSDGFLSSVGTMLPNHLAAVNVWAPVIDGVHITGLALPVPADAPPKPIIIGYNSEEGILFLEPFEGHFSQQMYFDWLFTLFGGDFDKALKLYPGKIDGKEDAMAAGVKVFTDYVFACGSREFAAGFDGWFYEFSQKPDFNLIPIPACAGQPCHSYELPFVFGNADLVEMADHKMGAFTLDEVVLSKAMRTYWTNFAKTQDPNQGDAVNVSWPVAGESNEYVLRLDSPISIETPTAASCKMWREIGYPVGG
jgi:carboxylesterase type B